MADTSQAKLTFLPWVRYGAAAAITVADIVPPSKGTQPTFASIDITPTVNGAVLPNKVSVTLRGPADVVGIDSHQIVRTDPRPGSHDFESNLFPTIEFDRPDFPWLFTPAAPTASSQLRPWLCLVVIRKQDGVTVTPPSVDAPLPALDIVAPASPVTELPNLVDSWAWAHAQAASSADDLNAVKSALDDAPRSLSRMLCPRVLVPETDYVACVVPTFDVGRKAGLGLPILDADLKTLAPAWVQGTALKSVRLPVYYSWEFRTGPAGSFESLARALRRSTPDGLGKRAVDISQPGFDWTPTGQAPSTSVQVEGALRPLMAAPPSSAWSDANTIPFETKLADIVNAPARIEATPNADPVLAPPLYGRWHRKARTVTPGAQSWFDQLNLDPRWRVVAALGTHVVQENQEALMASAWDQAPDIQALNQRRRQLQLTMAVGESLLARHVKPIANKATAANGFNEEMMLRFAAPAFSRLRQAPGAGQTVGPTLMAQITNTRLPTSAMHAAMRRIGRQRGPLSRRLARQDAARPISQSWVACLNYGATAPPQPPTRTSAVCPILPTVQAVKDAPWNRSFRINAETQALTPLSGIDPLPSAWDYPGHFRSAAAEHLARILPAPPTKPPMTTPATTGGLVLAQMNPRVSVPKLARAVLSIGSTALRPAPPGVVTTGVETVLAAPTFPQPMYAALPADQLLPGLDKVGPNSVVGLATNRAFVEAYMVGLNVEMASELLWRGYPTDQRGTCFRNFWGYDASQPGATSAPSVEDLADVNDLLSWTNAPLGEASGGASGSEFVLLLRTDLLRRYPNALIYLAPNVNGAPGIDGHLLPIFNGALPPDVQFFGFAVTPEAAVGNGTTTGHFIVIQEHPTEPRFGLSPSIKLSSTHLSIGTAPAVGVTHAATLAAITRRQPVRIAIRVSQLVALTSAAPR